MCQSAPLTRSVGIIFPRSVSGDFLANGENIGNDKLVVIPPGSGVDIVGHSEPDYNGDAAANIVASTIAWIGEALQQHSSIEISERVARIQVAKIAQQYVESHYQESVHIEDLCRVTGVGARTMQRCFRKYFDMPVSTYLKTVRLDSARRELLSAHSSEVTVTDIAMTNGCTHLGRFSVAFREQFGVSPREALDSRPGRK